MNHQNKTYVVTGVSSGVGAALVADLMARGAQVIGIDRIKPKSELAAFHQCDLRDRKQIDYVIENIQHSIDGLVNVAGVPGSADVETVVSVNFLALRRLTDALLPRIRDFGAVVNVASTAGANWRARDKQLDALLSNADWDDALAHFLSFGVNSVKAYDLTKEAVILYTMLASSRERHRGIRVNSISPGAVQTPILKHFYDTMNSKILNQLKQQAGGRDALPTEICGPVAFLLSTDAVWVNGADLLVDGGAEVAMNLPEIAIPAKTLAF